MRGDVKRRESGLGGRDGPGHVVLECLQHLRVAVLRRQVDRRVSLL